MSGRDRISAAEIQDFIDGRLDRAARSSFIARLLACPEVGMEVEAMRRQQEALRQIGQEILDEPVPPRLRVILRRASAARGNGRGGGWERRVHALAVVALA
jgi:anti-sigma factor RsiW